MRAGLDEAINYAVKRKFGSILGCQSLSKLKSGLKMKSAVAACNLPSRLYLCLVCLREYCWMPSLIDATGPLRRAADQESRREYVARSFEVAAPLLPVSIPLILLVHFISTEFFDHVGSGPGW